MRVLKCIVHSLAVTVTLCLLVLGGFFLFLNVSGIRSYVIVSGSMEPTIETGSLVFVKPEGKENVKPGDPVAYQLQDGPVVVHRLIEVAPDGSFVMKGDANDAADMETIQPSQVIGPVSRVLPKAGYFGQYFMQSGKGIPLTVLWLVLLMAMLHAADAFIDKYLRENAGYSREKIKMETN